MILDSRTHSSMVDPGRMMPAAASRRSGPCLDIAASKSTQRPAGPHDGRDHRGGGDGGRPDLAGVRVLVVEDQFVVALDLQILLYRLGCEVVGPVASVAEALVILRRERPDAALLDLHLRDGNVLPVAERLGALGVPYLLVTGRDFGPFTDVLKDAPALRKPAEEAQLRREIARLVRRPPPDA